MDDRHRYSPTVLRSLRHTRRNSLPESITITAHPQPNIPTLTPNPPTPFSALSLPSPLLASLTALSFTTATPIQSTAIPYARLGADLVAQATSGTGKTLTYAVVALDALHPPAPSKTALILVPSRELAAQVAGLFGRLSPARVVTLVGGTKEALDEQRLSRPAHVVVGTPGRVEAMLTRGSCTVAAVKLLVLDEADRLLDGSFGGAVERICAMLPPRQTLAFSATFSYAFRASLLDVMRQPAWIGGSAVVHAVEQRNISCENLPGKIDLLTLLLLRLQFNLCIVFFNAKKAAARVVKAIKTYPVRMIHAGMPQREREAVVRDVRNGKVRVLVTTDVLARGIDFDSCDMVVHMDVPQRPETYLHRVGRAGRFGRRGVSLLMYDPREVSDFRVLEEDLGYRIEPLDRHAFFAGESGFEKLPGQGVVGEKESLLREANVVKNSAGLENDGCGQRGSSDVPRTAPESRPEGLTNPSGGMITDEAARSEGEGLNSHHMDEDVAITSIGSKDMKKDNPKPSVPVPSLASLDQSLPEHVGEENATSDRVPRAEPNEVLHPVKISKEEQLLSTPTKRPGVRMDAATAAKKGSIARFFSTSLSADDEAGHPAVSHSDGVAQSQNSPEDPATPPKKRRRARLASGESPSERNGDRATSHAEEMELFDSDEAAQSKDALKAYADENGTCLSKEATREPGRIGEPSHRSLASGPDTWSDRVRREVDKTNDCNRHPALAAASKSNGTDNGQPDMAEQLDCNVNVAHWKSQLQKEVALQTQVDVRPPNGLLSRVHDRDKHADVQPASKVPIEAPSQQCREAWERYATAAYDTGYREAYEEAFQMARKLRQDLEGSTQTRTAHIPF